MSTKLVFILNLIIAILTIDYTHNFFVYFSIQSII
jgi:hypothetical protein